MKLNKNTCFVFIALISTCFEIKGAKAMDTGPNQEKDLAKYREAGRWELPDNLNDGDMDNLNVGGTNVSDCIVVAMNKYEKIITSKKFLFFSRSDATKEKAKEGLFRDIKACSASCNTAKGAIEFLSKVNEIEKSEKIESPEKMMEGIKKACTDAFPKPSGDVYAFFGISNPTEANRYDLEAISADETAASDLSKKIIQLNSNATADLLKLVGQISDRRMGKDKRDATLVFDKLSKINYKERSLSEILEAFHQLLNLPETPFRGRENNVAYYPKLMNSLKIIKEGLAAKAEAGFSKEEKENAKKAFEFEKQTIGINGGYPEVQDLIAEIKNMIGNSKINNDSDKEALSPVNEDIDKKQDIPIVSKITDQKK